MTDHFDDDYSSSEAKSARSNETSDDELTKDVTAANTTGKSKADASDNDISSMARGRHKGARQELLERFRVLASRLLAGTGQKEQRENRVAIPRSKSPLFRSWRGKERGRGGGKRRDLPHCDRRCRGAAFRRGQLMLIERLIGALKQRRRKLLGRGDNGMIEKSFGD